jgi:hypothetical protein
MRDISDCLRNICYTVLGHSTTTIFKHLVLTMLLDFHYRFTIFNVSDEDWD